jgi:predicted negative regulator of RcsB-dependent stress response
MAQQLDLQEQEQLDALKAFWDQYGNLITWVLTIGLLAFAAFEGYVRYAQSKALAAGTLYGELDKAATAGDAAQAARVFEDMKANYGHGFNLAFLPVPVYTQQGGLLAAKVQSDKGQAEAAAKTLEWVAQNGSPQYANVAHLRRAGVLADLKRYDEALKELDEVKLPAFAALAADRRGDVLAVQGKNDAAKAAYQAAWNGMAEKTAYRMVLETKLAALGAAPAASAASAAASGAAQ